MYRAIKPENRIEKLVYWLIVGTYVIYPLGLLYPLYSLFAWCVFCYICYTKWQSQKNHKNYNYDTFNYEEYLHLQQTQTEAKISIPPIIWVWLVGMLVMGIGTVISCFHVGLEFKEIIREIIRWGMRGSLMALFLLVGCLSIRPQIIYRAVCILCLQSLLIIPICYGAYFARLPEMLYSLPIIGQLTAAGEIYFEIRFYSLGDALRTSQELRLFLFTPWGPALGLVGSIYFFIALQEKNRLWRIIGIVGSLAMCVVSGSRTAIVAIPAILLLTTLINNWRFFLRPKTQIMAGFGFFLAGLFSSLILNTAENAVDSFVGARSKSSRVRAALARIGLRRWKDSPIWGYAQQVEGPEAVAKMPIGSHHTWIGLLYLKGIVGFISLLIPVLFSFILLLFKSQTSDRAKLGLKILLVLILYSFAEEIYLLAYLYWPGLVLLGIAFNDKVPVAKPPETSYYLSQLPTNVN